MHSTSDINMSTVLAWNTDIMKSTYMLKTICADIFVTHWWYVDAQMFLTNNV